MGQSECKTMNYSTTKSEYIGQFECPNKNKVITGIMKRAQQNFEQIDSQRYPQKQTSQLKENRGNHIRTGSQKITKIKSTCSQNQSIDVKQILGESTNMFRNINSQRNQHNNSNFSSQHLNSIQILKDKTTSQNKNNVSIGEHLLSNNKEPHNISKNKIDSIQYQSNSNNDQTLKRLASNAFQHLNANQSYKKILEEDDDKSDNRLQTKNINDSFENNNQISNFHKQITDTIQKDQMNNSFQTVYRESVRNNGQRNNLNNTSQIERFSITSAQRRMSTRYDNRDNELFQEGILRKQSSKNNQQQNSNTNQKNVKMNCSFMEYFIGLPEAAQKKIFYFLFDEQHNLRLINSLFYFKISEILESEMVALDNSFIKKNMAILSFKDSYSTQESVQFKDIKGMRMDRHIISEVLPCLKGYSTKISFSYKYASAFCNKKKNQRYFCEYQFDSVDDKKVVWAFKEECRHNFDPNTPTFVQPITAVKVGDNIKISINFYSLGGMIDLNSIIWNEPTFNPIPKIPIMIDPNEIHEYDPNRICEIEYLYTSWFLYNYFHNEQKCKLDFFEPYLHLNETRCAGVDVITSKLIFQAKVPGLVPKSLENFGVKVKVVQKNEEAVCSLKKLGIFSDQENQIELRVGDIFIFYISKGD